VSVTTKQVLSTAPQAMEPHTTREWLEALSKGTCDLDAFSRAMTDYCRSVPDGSWELISLLDQYYRLGKLDSELFQSLKSRFQSVAIDADTSGAWRVPTLSKQKAPTAAASKGASVAAVSIAKPNGERRSPNTTELLCGRYRLGRVLNRDGVGTVYEAIDQDRLDLSGSGQTIAIKVIHKTISGNADLYIEQRREFQYLQSLAHPNILRVHEFDRDGDTVFFSMELLSGLPLSAVLANRKHLALERAHATTIIRHVGDAIQYAHLRGVVHGDIGPRNIFITDEGDIRVLGFGASRSAAPHPQISEFAPDQRVSVATWGDATYRGLAEHHPEAGDDLCALACLACVLLTGFHPFNNRSAAEARAMRLKPRRPAGLTRRQWHAIRSGLHFKGEQRPPDIAKWLQQVFRHHSAGQLPILSVLMSMPPARRRFPAVRTMVLLIALGAAVGVWITSRVESAASIAAIMQTQMRRAATLGDALVTRMSDAVRRAAGAASAKPEVSQSVVAPAAPSSGSAANAVTPLAPSPSPASDSSNARNQAGEPAGITPPIPADSSPSRIELDREATDVPADAAMALVPVRRRGNLLRDATFIWWTETGSAKAGADFEPVTPRMETIKAGKDRLNLRIPIVSDSTRRQAKSFFVVIDQPGPHVSLGSRTVAKVSILPPG